MAEPGNNQETLEVVRRRPGYRRKYILLFVAYSLVLGAGAYQVGSWHHDDEYHAAIKQEKSLTAKVKELELENRTLEQQLAITERGMAVDRETLISAQQKIRELEDQLKSERSELALFRTIVAPEEAETGLQVQRFGLEPTRSDRRWRYHLVLTQIGDNSRFISGDVTANVVGKEDGEIRSISLSDLSDDLDESEVRFRFRYFQRVEGTLVLPEGFEPQEVRVFAEAEGRSGKRVERVFDWYNKAGD